MTTAPASFAFRKCGAGSQGNRFDSFFERDFQALVLIPRHRKIYRERTPRQRTCRANFFSHDDVLQYGLYSWIYTAIGVSGEPIAGVTNCHIVNPHANRPFLEA